MILAGLTLTVVLLAVLTIQNGLAIEREYLREKNGKKVAQYCVPLATLCVIVLWSTCGVVDLAICATDIEMLLPARGTAHYARYATPKMKSQTVKVGSHRTATQ